MKGGSFWSEASQSVSIRAMKPGSDRFSTQLLGHFALIRRVCCRGRQLGLSLQTRPSTIVALSILGVCVSTPPHLMDCQLVPFSEANLHGTRTEGIRLFNHKGKLNCSTSSRLAACFQVVSISMTDWPLEETYAI